MNKFIESMQKFLLPLANKMNRNRYIRAMRDGFVLSLPYTMVGSILTSLISMPFLADVISEQTLTIVKTFVSPTSVFSNNIIAIFVVIGIAYSLANHYKINPLHTTVVSLVVYLMTLPISVTTQAGEVVLNVIPMSELGAKAIFTGIFIAFTTTEIYRWAITHKLTIKLPDSVPGSIQDSFTSFIPAGFAMFYGAVLRAVFAATSFETLTGFIFKMFQQPLSLLGNSVPASLFAGVLNNIFWFFGLHGQTMVGSVFSPFWNAASAENIAALEAGLVLPNLISKSFVNTFMNYGYWISIPLLLALFFYKKKRKDWAEVAKISLIPGLFNIYEPLMFGLPLVLNPFMLIPMILTPLISGISAYLATVAGIIPYCTGVALPITTPMILAGMLSTNSITGGLLQLILIPLLAAMWYLFLSIQDRSERASGLYHEEE